jgi:hypothetical protein
VALQNFSYKKGEEELLKLKKKISPHPGKQQTLKQNLTYISQ